MTTLDAAQHFCQTHADSIVHLAARVPANVLQRSVQLVIRVAVGSQVHLPVGGRQR